MAEGGITDDMASCMNVIDDSVTHNVGRQRGAPARTLLDTVLCYLYNKMDFIVQDTLVKLTVDYFDSITIEIAKRSLYECDVVNSTIDVPFVRRKSGPNNDRKNVEDMLFKLHKCPNGLPIFVVSDLSLLPLLDIKNVDFSHLLGEIRALRAEMANLRESVAGIENKTPVAPEWPSLPESSPQLSQRDRLPLYVQLSAPKQRDSTVTAAWKQRASNTTSADTMAAISTAASATGPSGRGDSDGYTTVVKRKKARRNASKATAVVGKMQHSAVKAKTGRYAAVFVSHLLPDTTTQQMKAFVQEAHHLVSKCSKLETKHDSYSSFKIEVTCDNIADIYDAGKWPEGAYVRRYYNVATA